MIYCYGYELPHISELSALPAFEFPAQHGADIAELQGAVDKMVAQIQTATVLSESSG